LVAPLLWIPDRACEPLSRIERAVALLVLSLSFWTIATAAGETAGSSAAWSVPDISALPDDEHGRQVRFGRELIIATYKYIGPFVDNPTKHYAGNDLACGNCHLEAGTKKFGLPIFGLYGDFPRYSARSGEKISIEDRINSCMTRSMNGRPLPNGAPELQALVAYVKFLSSEVPPGKQVPGLGSGEMPDLDRAADPARGKQVYARACLACHNSDGSGFAANPKVMVLGYVMPPLWGSESFNNGAGMARIITLANFVHFNMPHGANYLSPALSPAEAWDVAAYVESQARPQKSGLDRDFSSDLLEKPVDAPYGPYADDFAGEQHRYGPFGPIRAEIARLKAAKAKAPTSHPK
jgi:thiosulfate dehydrogenase